MDSELLHAEGLNILMHHPRIEIRIPIYQAHECHHHQKTKNNNCSKLTRSASFARRYSQLFQAKLYDVMAMSFRDIANTGLHNRSEAEQDNLNTGLPN